MKALSLLCAAVVAAGSVAALSIPRDAQAQDKLTIVAWGGAAQAAQRQAFFEPFAKASGTKITEGEYNGEIAKMRSMVESKNVTWDVVDAITQTALAGCADGTLETIDWNRISVDRSKLFGGDMQECAVPMLIYAVVLAYDTTKMNPAPSKIGDLFDLQKFPGKRALQKDPSVNLEWALLADGVPMADVYKVLATPEGVDRAFKKLDTIKKDVVWWESGAQPPQLLADGQVAMASDYNGRFYDAIKKDKKSFQIMWDAQAFDWDWWVIVKGTPNLDAAYKFVNYATQAGAQADLTKYISYGPANKDATPNIDPAVLKDLPTAPENMSNVLVLDPQFWADNGDQLRERFNAWLAN
jgi:putative spermidine/putrescine transport system substrate-binding protein